MAKSAYYKYGRRTQAHKSWVSIETVILTRMLVIALQWYGCMKVYSQCLKCLSSTMTAYTITALSRSDTKEESRNWKDAKVVTATSAQTGEQPRAIARFKGDLLRQLETSKIGFHHDDAQTTL